MAQEIIEILASLNPYVDIDRETKLLEEDLLDSIEILLLVDELEKKYQIKIPLDELSEEDFTTVSAIASMVERLLYLSGDFSYTE